MAWNPSPEVAVARDAATKLDDADQCIVLWVNQKKDQFGMASYGKTKLLCADAKKMADVLFPLFQKELEKRMF